MVVIALTLIFVFLNFKPLQSTVLVVMVVLSTIKQHYFYTLFIFAAAAVVVSLHAIC